ncbi:LamB/YcsF family protein [Alkalibacterium subtropicum]|uniref:LamB/YcsF family protein n=1 Tax=Alkalibacterium subtropicum TaxID=753702 RepID=UPI000A3F6FE8
MAVEDYNRARGTFEGEINRLQPNTICVHGDNPKAVQFAKRFHNALKERRIDVSAAR